MKNLIYILVVTLAISSCMTVQQKAEQQWRTDDSYINYFLVPQAFKTCDEAVSVIKLSQPNFCETRGEEIVNLQVDQYGLLLKTRWESSNTEYKVKPVHTFTLDSGMSTTYVGSYETTTDAGYNSYSLLFNKISSFSLIHRIDLNRANKWLIIFWADDSDESLLVLRAKDKGTAVDIINAVYTLALKSGAKIKMPRTGMYCSLLTLNQATTLGKTDLKGIVIATVAKDSPAEKGGIRINDIITNVNGSQITTVEDFNNQVEKDGLKKLIMTVIRKKEFNVATNVYNYEQIEITVTL